ncbi:MAG: phage terminase large subunit [Clostridiales bacterium]|nr:phage terminase large subunit [Clostridiales bacterium]
MTIDIGYKPTEKQALFHASTADEVLYGGAAGGGKSYAICWDAFLRCLKWPGTHAYLFRRSYPELEMTLVRTMQRIVPGTLGKYVASAHEMRFANGSVAHFCHLQNEGEGLLKYQGAEIHWLYFDELTHFTKPMYDYLRTRLRAERRLGITPCVRAASNPGGPGHAWVKARFVDSTGAGTRCCEMPVRSDVLGSVSTRRLEYIPATVTDNPHITKDYVVELEQKPRALRDALLYGKWDAFDGQAFPEFTDDPAHYGDGLYTHVIQPFDIPLHWTRVASFDHGYTRPFSLGVWAIDEEGRAYRYKELYGCVPGEANTGLMLTPGEIGRRIGELLEPELREGIHVQGVADPAIWDRSRGMSVEEQIRSAFGGLTFQKGDNTRLPGKMQLHERLKFDGEGRPMLYVFTNCRDFIRTLPSLVYDARRPEDIDTAGEDHIYDETRYFLMSRPIAPRPRGREERRIYNPLA